MERKEQLKVLSKVSKEHDAKLKEERESLKPCPFCGEREAYIDDNYDSYYEKNPKVFISCGHCGARGEPTDHKETAIAMWNRRYIEERLRLRIDDLVRKLTCEM